MTLGEIFGEVRKEFGFVPRLIKEMAKSRAVVLVYRNGQKAMASASLSPADQQVVQLAVSAINQCDYCRAAHQMGCRLEGISVSDLEAIQDPGQLPRPSRLEGLVYATRLVMSKRVLLDTADLEALQGHGIGRAQLYEIVALVGLKTISNYINHIASTRID